MQKNGEIERLVSYFSRLPGMGGRSALRLVIHLLRYKETVLHPILTSLQNVYENLKICEICGNIDTRMPCNICSDNKRDSSTICVVADISDLWTIERAGFYNGMYHVLGNKLSAIEGVTPDDININGLYDRILNNKIDEVIIALNADLDGQTTLFFVKDRIGELGVKITTLSHGVPIGSDLEYLDNSTILAAFSQRHPV